MLSLHPDPACNCPNCTPIKKENMALKEIFERGGRNLIENRFGFGEKKFSYPHNLPHNLSPLEYIFFSFSVQDRHEINLSKIFNLKKDAEEISILLHNIYHAQGIEATKDFMKKSGIEKILLDA